MPLLLLEDLPLDSDLNVKLNIKKGNRQHNPRETTKVPFKFKVSDGFDVIYVKVNRIKVGHDASIIIPNNFKLFLKKSKSVTQSQYKELSADEFEDSVKSRWSKISQSDIQKRKDEGKTTAEGIVFEFFVYIPRPRSQQQQQQAAIRCATVSSIQYAAERL